MSEKEKAEELYSQMYRTLFHTNADPIHCKQCALIAIEEIRDNLPLITDIQNYWINVKKELEKL